MTYFNFAVLVSVIVVLLSLAGVICDTANHTGPFDTIVFRIAFIAFLIPIGVWTIRTTTKGTNCKYVEEEKSTYEAMVKSQTKNILNDTETK